MKKASRVVEETDEEQKQLMDIMTTITNYNAG